MVAQAPGGSLEETIRGRAQDPFIKAHTAKVLSVAIKVAKTDYLKKYNVLYLSNIIAMQIYGIGRKHK